MTRELNRVTLGLLVGFGLVALSAAFWPVIQADSLLARDDNARNVIAEQRIQRGTIYDRDGEPLATSRENEIGVMQRVYPHPEAAGAVGYYSLNYGAAGIEAAYDSELRGDDLRSEWEKAIDNALHRPPQGQDVRATLDLDVQQAAASALRGYAGAAIVVHVPSGRVLAMVSLPSYDPNKLDATWDRLTQEQITSPLLNRALVGLYQPGGVLQTVTLSAILAAQPDLKISGAAVLNTEAADAQTPVVVYGRGAVPEKLRIACLPGAPDRALTLAEAYAFGCPAPFATVVASGVLTPQQLWERWQVLGLLSPPSLDGFETTAGRPPLRLTDRTPDQILTAALTGQGDLTITPLQLAQVIAAVAGTGHGVPLHMVDAVRDPGAETWQPVPVPADRPALLRADVAEAVRLAMLQAAAESPFVRLAGRGDLVLYGHTALAFGGPEATPYAWFAGFVDQSSGAEAAAILAVVVVEDESNLSVAAHVAGEAFAAAAGAHNADSGGE